MRTQPASLICFVALAAIFVAGAIPAHATTFDFSTLNIVGSGTSAKYYQGATAPANYVFNYKGNQQNPWTEGTGASQASINFTIPGQGNNSGLLYLNSSAAFPLPTGETLGTGENGYSGDYAYNNGFPLYFAFSNPAYDVNCGFNCNTITNVPVTFDSIDFASLSSGMVLTITGYSDQGHTAIDTATIIGLGYPNVQTANLNWAGVDYVTVTGGSGYYVNDIDVNDPNVAPPTIPEPNSLILLGTGLVGLGGLIRRKFKTA